MTTFRSYWIVLAIYVRIVVGVISVRQNIALRKTVYQSTTLNHLYNWTADLAIDNKTEFTGFDCRCCAGVGWEDSAKGPWWEIDLGSVVKVGKVKVFGRKDSAYYQLYGFKMFVSETTPYKLSTSPYLYINNVTAQEYLNNQGITDVLIGEKPLRYIALALHRKWGNNSMVLMVVCEVQVYSPCDNYHFEPDCAQCHCNGAPCNKSSGICPGGCTPGWKGQRCDQVCSPGTYGPDCQHNCGKCRSDDPCDISTGKCPGGCMPGYRGDTCQEVCPHWLYGQGCALRCGHCYGNITCNHVTGICQSCVLWYQGDWCMTEKICEPNTYSVDCVPCGHCLQGDTCDVVTGYCPRGCETTHMGDHCVVPKARVHLESVLIGGGAGLVLMALIVGFVLGIRHALQKRRSATENPTVAPDCQDQPVCEEHRHDLIYQNQSMYLELEEHASDYQDEHLYCTVIG